MMAKTWIILCTAGRERRKNEGKTSAEVRPLLHETGNLETQRGSTEHNIFGFSKGHCQDSALRHPGLCRIRGKSFSVFTADFVITGKGT